MTWRKIFENEKYILWENSIGMPIVEVKDSAATNPAYPHFNFTILDESSDYLSEDAIKKIRERVNDVNEGKVMSTDEAFEKIFNKKKGKEEPRKSSLEGLHKEMDGWIKSLKSKVDDNDKDLDNIAAAVIQIQEVIDSIEEQFRDDNMVLRKLGDDFLKFRFFTNSNLKELELKLKEVAKNENTSSRERTERKDKQC